MVAVHVAHIQQGQKMNGVFVKIDPIEFQKMINSKDGLMIIVSKAGVFNNLFLYLTSYKGFVFYLL